MAQDSVLVLTYHSVSSEPGPTSMPAEAFRRQMEELSAAGYRSLTVQGFLDWKAGRGEAGRRRVLITFDDGFADFAASAVPALQDHGFTALMFVPAAKVGASEDWGGANTPARPLMTWGQIRALDDLGMEFGSHTLTHPDLTRLSPEERREEIGRSAQVLAERLGKPTRTFAAPYGRVNPAVLADIARVYDLAFGVRLDKARRDCDPIDIPRVEMHYFRDAARFRAFLEGDELYFNARRALRNAREAATGLLGGRRYG